MVACYPDTGTTERDEKCTIFGFIEFANGSKQTINVDSDATVHDVINAVNAFQVTTSKAGVKVEFAGNDRANHDIDNKKIQSVDCTRTSER